MLRSAPDGFDASRADEAMKDNVRTCPLSIESARARIREDVEKLLRAFISHAEYVRTCGRGGRALRCRCLGCGRYVINHYTGSYALEGEGGAARADPIWHSECSK